MVNSGRGTRAVCQSLHLTKEIAERMMLDSLMKSSFYHNGAVGWAMLREVLFLQACE